MNRHFITIIVALVALWTGAETFKSFVFYKNGVPVATVPVVDVDSMVFEQPEITPNPPVPPINPPIGPDEPQFEMVDLGLSVMWASMNVGATTPDDYGNYYAWGELEPKEYYDVSNYKHSGINMGDDISGTEYDVATAIYGDKWRMPTQLECKELIACCQWSWEQYKDGNWGIKVTGPNGNSIFLPAGGFINYSGAKRVGEYGSYWTSTADYADQSHYLCFESSRLEQTSWDGATYVGQLIRPVYGDKPSVNKGALYDFFIAANGYGWKNKSGWLTEAPLSEWFGVETDSEGNVVKISLPDNNLSGKCIIDERLSHLVEVDFRGARFDYVNIHPGESMKTLSLDNCMAPKGKIENLDVDKFVLKNVPDMGILAGSCEEIEIYNCNFKETSQPLNGVSMSSLKLVGCTMVNIGGSANKIYVENTHVTETWYFVTKEQFTAKDSKLSTLCSGDFHVGSLLTFDNVTMWRTNWNENVTETVTFSFVFDYDTWQEHFPY